MVSHFNKQVGHLISRWSELLRSLLEKPVSTLPQHLIMSGLVFGSVTGFWAWFGTVEEIRLAQGNLIPIGQAYEVQTITEGEIVTLLVESGQAVESGQVIAELDHRLIEKDIERLEASLTAKQEQLARTQLLIEQTQTELNTLQSITAAYLQAKRSAISQEQAAARTQRRILEQIDQNTPTHEASLDTLQFLVERGAFAEEELFQTERNLRTDEQLRTESLGAIEQSSLMINRLQAELTRTQTSAQTHKLDLIKQLQQLQIEATNLATQVLEDETLLSTQKTLLEQMSLVAPVEGTIFYLGVANTGQVVPSGHTVAEIAPIGASLIFSGRLSRQEAEQVEVGMKVNLKLEAFPYQKYGVVSGFVQSISPDAQQGEPLGAAYQVEVALAKTSVQHGGEVVNFKAGQTASAEIVIRKRRIMSLLLDPIRMLQRGDAAM